VQKEEVGGNGVHAPPNAAPVSATREMVVAAVSAIADAPPVEADAAPAPPAAEEAAAEAAPGPVAAETAPEEAVEAPAAQESTTEQVSPGGWESGWQSAGARLPRPMDAANSHDGMLWLLPPAGGHSRGPRGKELRPPGPARPKHNRACVRQVARLWCARLFRCMRVALSIQWVCLSAQGCKPKLN
jgi:hypothetical protein